MSPSKRQAGNLFQDWIQHWLEERGWMVHNQKSVARAIKVRGKLIFVSQRNDIFGGIDLIAMKENLPTLWIQATLDSGKGRKMEKLAAIPFSWSDNVQIWIDRGGRQITTFDKSGACIGKIIRRVFYPIEGSDREF